MRELKIFFLLLNNEDSDLKHLETNKLNHDSWVEDLNTALLKK